MSNLILRKSLTCPTCRLEMELPAGVTRNLTAEKRGKCPNCRYVISTQQMVHIPEGLAEAEIADTLQRIWDFIPARGGQRQRQVATEQSQRRRQQADSLHEEI